MATLGSVLPPEPSGPRGLDLRVEVDVPRQALGLEDGVFLELPDELEADDGAMHARTVSPHDEPGGIRLRLPADFPDRGVLRLRGQGAAGDAAPGDLWVRVCLTNDALEAVAPTASSGLRRWALAGGVLLLIAIAAAFLTGLI